nr:hypothetical protein [Actinomycetota bacterium]
MKNPLKHSRTRAAALVTAALFGAGGGAAVATALDSGETVRQVTVSRAAKPAA